MASQPAKPSLTMDASACATSSSEGSRARPSVAFWPSSHRMTHFLSLAPSACRMLFVLVIRGPCHPSGPFPATRNRARGTLRQLPHWLRSRRIILLSLLNNTGRDLGHDGMRAITSIVGAVDTMSASSDEPSSHVVGHPPTAVPGLIATASRSGAAGPRFLTRNFGSRRLAADIGSDVGKLSGGVWSLSWTAAGFPGIKPWKDRFHLPVRGLLVPGPNRRGGGVFRETLCPAAMVVRYRPLVPCGAP